MSQDKLFYEGIFKGFQLDFNSIEISKKYDILKKLEGDFEADELIDYLKYEGEITVENYFDKKILESFCSCMSEDLKKTEEISLPDRIIKFNKYEIEIINLLSEYLEDNKDDIKNGNSSDFLNNYSFFNKIIRHIDYDSSLNDRYFKKNIFLYTLNLMFPEKKIMDEPFFIKRKDPEFDISLTIYEDISNIKSLDLEFILKHIKGDIYEYSKKIGKYLNERFSDNVKIDFGGEIIDFIYDDYLENLCEKMLKELKYKNYSDKSMRLIENEIINLKDNIVIFSNFLDSRFDYSDSKYSKLAETIEEEFPDLENTDLIFKEFENIVKNAKKKNVSNRN